MRLSLHYKPHDKYLATGEYFTRAAERLGIELGGEDAILNIESGWNGFKKGKVTGCYDIDVFNEGIPSGEAIAQSDVYFHTNPSNRSHSKATLLPHGFDPELCDIENTGEYDVVLSGLGYGFRNRIHGVVRENFKYLDVGYGTSTPEYLKQLARAKIILNVTGFKEMNRRVYDGMALGVTLVDDCPNTELLGEKGKHFLTFKDEKDIIDVIKDVLSNTDKYKKIRKEGREHAYKNHTYDIRLKTAYDKLKEKYDEIH